ncbi:hypothetical protein SteCoe_10148 [Stentor coeruleus]|uniref:Uncharacterized protein n=1 Tax=Stentor coeruleus TaxID=5963 RepID=A0A1R2CGA0_9CILI|nr:hypothetical protein SteCoe_10148 [Stentor coeruleus]
MPGKKKPTTKTDSPQKSSTPKPDPNHNIKQAPTIKEKDYSTAFTLLLHPQLEDLDLRIESRQRLLDSVSSKETHLISKAIQKYINSMLIKTQELNQEILKLKKEKKENVNQQKLSKVYEEIYEEGKIKETIEEDIAEKQEMMKKANTEFIANREKLEEEISKHLDKHEALKMEIILKDLDIQAVKDNIMQISSQMNIMKEINSKFNEKIEKINDQIGPSNKRVVEATVQIENAQEVKNRISEFLSIHLLNVKKSLKYYKRFKRIHKFFTNKEKDLNILKDIEGKINEALDVVPNFQKEESAQNLEKILKSLIVPAKKLEKRPIEEKSLENLSQYKLHLIQNELKFKEIEMKSKEKKIPIKESWVLEINDRIKSNNEVFQERIGYLSKQAEFYKNQTNGLMKKSEDINAEASKKESAIEKSRKKLAENQEKIEDLTKKNQNTTGITEELKTKIAEIKKSLYKPVDSSVSSMSNREKQISRLLLQLDVLKQEINTRDTEIVNKHKEKQKVEDKYEVLKQKMQKLSSKMKSIEAEILAKINEEIEVKDKQIEILKEMLRGSHADLKVKKVVLSNYKSKLATL